MADQLDRVNAALVERVAAIKKENQKLAQEVGWPVDPEDITKEWLSALFSAKVGSFKTTLIGIGFIGDAHKVEISYVGESGSAPSSCIIKLAKGDAEYRKMNSKLFVNETTWYRQYTSMIPLKEGMPLLEGYRVIFPRFLKMMVELDLVGHAAKLEAGIAAAAQGK